MTNHPRSHGADELKSAEQKAVELSRKLNALYEEEARLERETSQAWAEVDRLGAEFPTLR